MAEAQSTILIVDDDADDLSAIAQALGPLGASIVTLQDPHEVLPTVRGLSPDVVVLDALLPGLSGFDLCKEIKTDAELRSTQVLILTAVYLRQQYRHEALQQFKADGFLTKPFRAPELQRLVGRLLTRKARMPQGSLLSRLGLPGSAKPAKRSIFGRLFSRAGEGSEADTRLTPPMPPRRSPEKPARASSLAEDEAPVDSSSSASEPALFRPRGPIALPSTLPQGQKNIDENAPAPTAEVEEAEETTEEGATKDERAAKGEKEEDVQQDLFPRSEPSSSVIGESLVAEAAASSAEAEPGAADPASEVEPASAVDESPSVEASDSKAAEPAPAVWKATEAEITGAPEADDESAAFDVEAKRADGAAEALVAVEEALEEPESETAATLDGVEDAVASLENTTNVGDAEMMEDELSAAEALEATPLEGARDVAREPVDEGPAPDRGPEPTEIPSGIEPSKTLPAFELPESFKAATLASTKGGSRSELASEAEAPSRAESVPEASEPVSSEESMPVAAETKSAPSADPEPPAPLEKPRRPRRRVGEAPIFDEEDFDAELNRELSKCRRVDRPLTLILIQLDDLDQIVELFGKEFREDVLWHVADQAMVSLREVDIVGMISSKDRIAMTAFASDRYGGTRIVTRMRRTVGKHPIRVGEELPPIIPALAFGMASYPEDGGDVELLIARAEEELRSAKAHRED